MSDSPHRSAGGQQGGSSWVCGSGSSSVRWPSRSLWHRPPVRAQSCSDGNECTNPDACSDGTCSGAAIPGACDDGNPCTTNDTCVSGTCQGTPNMGATCGMAGCEGTCGPSGICIPDQAKQGQPCTDGLGQCTTNDKCTATFCFGSIVQCPDADSNKCTLDVCNPENGQCITIGGIPPCGECEACDTQSGCFPSNEGAACNDFNECTGSGTCQEGSCQAGAPLPAGTATHTPSTPAATDTVTPTRTGAPATDTPGTPTATRTSAPTNTATVPSTGGIATPTDTPPFPPLTATDTPTVGTATPVDTATEGLTETPTSAPTGIPTGTVTATVTFTPTGIPTGTAEATVTPTAIPTGLPTGTATATVTVTATGIATGTASATVTATRTATPTVPVPATSSATVTHTPLPVVASIIVGSVVGEPGATVSFPVTLESDANIAGAQVDIAYAAAAAVVAKDGAPDCTVNPDIDKNDTSYAFQPSGCTPGEDCTGIRAIVLSLENLDTIPDGARLFSCNVALAADASDTYPLTCSKAGAGNDEGNKVGADCTSGTITVAVPSGATIVVGDVIGAAGQDATLTVSLETELEVAGTRNDVTFPAGVGVVADNGGARPAR